MSDLISRQDAIDAIDALHDKPNAWLEYAVDAVKKLPSAQPEGTCESCLHQELEWDEEPCDGCTVGGDTNHYKPSMGRRTDERTD